MEFRKYMHVERFGNSEVADINIGTCYIFPILMEQMLQFG